MELRRYNDDAPSDETRKWAPMIDEATRTIQLGALHGQIRIT
jgi:hypothetical protein